MCSVYDLETKLSRWWMLEVSNIFNVLPLFFRKMIQFDAHIVQISCSTTNQKLVFWMFLNRFLDGQHLRKTHPVGDAQMLLETRETYTHRWKQLNEASNLKF